MKTSLEFLKEKGLTTSSHVHSMSVESFSKLMEEYAEQFKTKWIPFEIWIETALPGAIVNTYSDVYLHQFECEFDGESIQICGYNYYPGETKIWIMDIPELPNT